MTSEASFQLQSLGSAVVKEANYGAFLQLEGGKVTVEALYCPGGYSLLWPLQGGSNVYERVGKSVIYFGAVKGRKRANLLASRCILWLCKSRRSILLL